MVYSTLTDVRGVAEIAASILARVQGSALNPVHSTLTRVTGGAGQAFAVDAGAPLTSDPFEPVTLAASIGAGTATSWLWELVSSSNPAVTAFTCGPDNPAAASTFYYAPPTVNGAVLTWRVTAFAAGESNSTDTVVHTIRNHVGPWLPLGNGAYRAIQVRGNYGPDDIPA